MSTDFIINNLTTEHAEITEIKINQGMYNSLFVQFYFEIAWDAEGTENYII